MSTVNVGNKPFVLGKDEGTPIWFTGGLMTLKLPGEATGNRWTVLEFLLPPGQLTPPHIHHAEDEAWYVLEGEVNFHADGKPMKATAGSFVFAPREIVHGFQVSGDGSARMLVFASPSGFEHFVEEFGDRAAERGLPEQAPLDIPRLLELTKKYHVEMMPPDH